jgi:Uma2 family endonuclease
MTVSQPWIDHWDEMPVRFTATEFIELAQHPPVVDWPGKIELVGGEIVRMAPANVRHWNMQRIVFLRLQSVLAAAGIDWIVGQEPTVRLDSDTIREPDVAVLRDPDLTGTLFDGAALFLAIEVADTSLAIDLGRKRRDYAAARVPHYWVVDLNGRCIHVMTDPVASDYAMRSLVRFGEPLAVPDTGSNIVID